MCSRLGDQLQLCIHLLEFHLGLWRLVWLLFRYSLYFMCTEIDINFNPFLFIRGLSCPPCVQTLFIQNCLNPTSTFIGCQFSGQIWPRSSYMFMDLLYLFKSLVLCIRKVSIILTSMSMFAY